MLEALADRGGGAKDVCPPAHSCSFRWKLAKNDKLMPHLWEILDPPKVRCSFMWRIRQSDLKLYQVDPKLSFTAVNGTDRVVCEEEKLAADT